MWNTLAEHSAFVFFKLFIYIDKHYYHKLSVLRLNDQNRLTTLAQYR